MESVTSKPICVEQHDHFAILDLARIVRWPVGAMLATLIDIERDDMRIRTAIELLLSVFAISGIQ